ncbi:MAG: extracellular solute-binding protein [Thermosphaera sp.]
MKRWFVILGLIGLLGSLALAEEITMITIRAWTVGPDKPAYYRAENLVLASARLNKFLEDVGANIRVEVEVDFWTESWDSYRRRNILAFTAGDPAVIPDIVCSSHLDIPVWAEPGWIIPLDDYIQRYWDFAYEDFFPHLWEAMTWKGRIYGVPQDIEVRMVWFRKDKLRALGWSEEEIDALPKKVAEKEVLLDDLAKIARQMQDAGLVEYGMIHRPTPGPDFFQFIVAYGGEYWDPATGKLVLDRAAVLEVLKFFHRLVYEYKVTPAGMTGWPWPAVHTAIADLGTAGFQLTGGMWNWAEWQQVYGVPEDRLWETIGWCLIPAGTTVGAPNQFGHPLCYMVTSASRHKELAFLLITLASSVDLNTNHCLTGSKLAIRRSQTAYQRFAEAKFLAEAAKLLPYQRFLPAHPKTGFYSTVLFEAIGAVEAGVLTPAEALKVMEDRLRAELGDDLIVR